MEKKKGDRKKYSSLKPSNPSLCTESWELNNSVIIASNFKGPFMYLFMVWEQLMTPGVRNQTNPIHLTIINILQTKKSLKSAALTSMLTLQKLRYINPLSIKTIVNLVYYLHTFKGQHHIKTHFLLTLELHNTWSYCHLLSSGIDNRNQNTRQILTLNLVA